MTRCEYIRATTRVAPTTAAPAADDHGKAQATALDLLWRKGLAFILGGLLLSGCAIQPLRHDALPEPELVAIRQSFERTVEAAHRDPNIDWQSGWLGNAMINLFGGTRQGLCYEWRDLVYDGVIPTVRRVGWEATGVVISKSTYSEHSAVVVYDPKRIRQEQILSATEKQPVYVLDAWRRGRADIYPMSVWLELPLIKRSPPQIKPLPVGKAGNVPATITFTPAY